MDIAADVALRLLKRAEEEEEPRPECESGNEYDGRLGLRISAIFVIMFGSTMGRFPRGIGLLMMGWITDDVCAGALIPVLARSGSILKIPSWLFFWAKYFGSGVIVATAFIHVRDFHMPPLDSADIDGVLAAPHSGQRVPHKPVPYWRHY